MAIQKFNKQFINKVVKDVEQLGIDKLDAMALNVHAKLVAATPVDYGQARAGWNFTLNEASTDIPAKPARVKGHKKGDATVPPPNPMPSNFARKGSDVYHISNFVSHIVFLNEGTSDQAPPNFIEREFVAAIKEVDESGFYI